MPSKYISPEDVINNPEFLEIDIRPDGDGGHKLNRVTHFTRIPDADGWDTVVYYRYIGSNNHSNSPRNKFGGYVYVLVNDAYPKICKIGMTTNTPEHRLHQINNAGVMDDWELAYSIKTGRPYDFEQAVHLKLTDVRIRNDREFFDIDLSEAIQLVKEMGPMFGPM